MLNQRLSQNDFSRLILELGLPAEADSGGAVRAHANALLRFAQRNPQHQLDCGSLLRDILVEKAAEQVVVPPISPWMDPPPERDDLVGFRQALARDGFIIEGKDLRRALPETADLPVADDEGHAHSFKVPQGHLDQAIQAHADGNWASANVAPCRGIWVPQQSSAH